MASYEPRRQTRVVSSSNQNTRGWTRRRDRLEFGHNRHVQLLLVRRCGRSQKSRKCTTFFVAESACLYQSAVHSSGAYLQLEMHVFNNSTLCCIGGGLCLRTSRACSSSVFSSLSIVMCTFVLHTWSRISTWYLFEWRQNRSRTPWYPANVVAEPAVAFVLTSAESAASPADILSASTNNFLGTNICKLLESRFQACNGQVRRGPATRIGILYLRGLQWS